MLLWLIGGVPLERRYSQPHTNQTPCSLPRAPCTAPWHLTSWLFPSEKLGTHSTKRDMVWALVLNRDVLLTEEGKDGQASPGPGRAFILPPHPPGCLLTIHYGEERGQAGPCTNSK